MTTAPLDLLAELLRIRSVTPTLDPAGRGIGDDGGEGAVAERLRVDLDAAGLETWIESSPEGRPSLIARIPGPTDVAPLVLLSHTDVVPVEEDSWRRDPFGGELHDGALWGRGAIDMKGIAVLHAAAAIELATSGATPTREVLVVAVADEEAGGKQGAGWLIRERPETLGFRDGAPPPEAIGEGAYGLSGILSRSVMPVVHGEKSPLTVRARATGSPGHGSRPPTDQAILALGRFVAAVAGTRGPRIHPIMREQFATLAEAAEGAQARLFALLAGRAGPTAIKGLVPLLKAKAGAIGNLVGDSVTPTNLAAGYAFNVVPGTAEAIFDCRLLPGTSPEEVLADLNRQGRRYGVRVEEIQRLPSGTSPRSPLYDVLTEVSRGLPSSPITVPSITPGATDLRFLRTAGASAYGWVPLVLTPEELATFHGHDERVPVDEFHRAVTATAQVVRRAAGEPSGSSE